MGMQSLIEVDWEFDQISALDIKYGDDQGCTRFNRGERLDDSEMRRLLFDRQMQLIARSNRKAA